MLIIVWSSDVCSSYLSYQFQTLDLNVALDEQVSAWESAGSPVTLTGISDRPLPLKADKIALGRLLDNLIANALNHGAPPVEIALTLAAGGAIITVRDHGPGIGPERRAEALRPFSRLDDGRTPTEIGSASGKARVWQSV